jgi:hypothetical protein
MSIFLFTKSKEPKAQRLQTKKVRNGIYIVCGILMIVALLVIFVGGFMKVIREDVYNRNHLTFSDGSAGDRIFRLCLADKRRNFLRTNEFERIGEK